MKRVRIAIVHLLSMIRFSHTIFALPFALLAAVMAWRIPTRESATVPFRPADLLGILICLIAARSAAMAFNRLIDREIDARNPRTAARHLPAGTLTARTVVGFTVICCITFVGATTLFLPNWLPLVLSLPVLAFLLSYSFTKRFTSLAHFWLGAALMLAPLATWIAIRGSEVIRHPGELVAPGMLGLAVLFWVAGFDVIYACQDLQFDRQARLWSLPARLGISGSLQVAAVCHLVMIAALALLPICSLWAGVNTGFGWLYWGGVAAIAGLLIYEHCLVKPSDLSRVNVAFFQVNAIVSFGLFCVGTIDLLL